MYCFHVKKQSTQWPNRFTALLIFLISFGVGVKGQILHQAAVGELYTFKIEPSMFNWSRQSVNEQFRYTASLQSYPDLPSWLRYMYSEEHHAGFLYGTTPDNLLGKSITLDIVALNRRTYETRISQLTIMVKHKVQAPNVVQMKIDNLNWVHLMDPGRVENLRNIFRKELWLESADDLSLVFMESAINMGGRLPLRPQQYEGVVVHLGSFARFSERLKQLQEEVRPLYKLPSCTYKRTSVQKVFENAGFKLDWCAFRILSTGLDPAVLPHNHIENGHNIGQDNNNHEKWVHGYANVGNEWNAWTRIQGHWQGLHRNEVPVRNYIDELAFAVAIPAVIFGMLFGILTIVLCFRNNKFYKGCTYPSVATSTVQMVQYSDTNTQPITTLKSLKNPNDLIDNISMHSHSPCAAQSTETTTNTYLRPKPPPYKGTTLTCGVNI